MYKLLTNHKVKQSDVLIINQSQSKIKLCTNYSPITK